MSAEERWAQRKEWEHEKQQGFDVEIKVTEKIENDPERKCFVSKCGQDASICYKIGKTAETWFIEIDLCGDHDSEDTAYAEFDAVRESYS